MDCHHVDFAPHKSEERINRALKVFPRKQLMRLLALTLHLLGAKRKSVAELVGMPEESVKTAIRLALRDGISALRDRRRSDVPLVAHPAPCSPKVKVHVQGEWLNVDLGNRGDPLKIPVASKIHARTVLLSLVNAGLLSAKDSAMALGISTAHCRDLARKLETQDVVDALVDKRQGQKQDYRVCSEAKAEIIQQLAARAIIGRSTSSNVLTEAVNERTQAGVSPRTVRWHVHKLGLTDIKKTLPELVESLKKTS